MAGVRAGQAFIAVAPEFKGWQTKMRAFVEAQPPVDVPANLEFDRAQAQAAAKEATAGMRVKVRVDDSGARRTLMGLRSQFSKPMLIPLAVTLGAGLLPTAGGLLGGGASLGVGLAAGIGTFAVLATKAEKAVKALAAADKQLTPAQEHLIDSQKRLKESFAKVIADPLLVRATARAYGALSEAMGPLAAFIRPVSAGMGSLFKTLGDSAASKNTKALSASLGQMSGSFIRPLGPELVNLAGGFSRLLLAFRPVADQMSAGLLKLTQRFSNWSKGLDHDKGFQRFLDRTKRDGPKVWHTLGDIGRTLLDVSRAMAPVTRETIKIVDKFAKFVTWADRVSDGLSTKLLAALILVRVSGFSPLASTIGKFIGKGLFFKFGASAAEGAAAANGVSFAGILGKLGQVSAALAAVWYSWNSLKAGFAEGSGKVAYNEDDHSVIANMWHDINPFQNVGESLGSLFRATGGRVAKGQPYVVGERRPEVFVPDQDGTIVPSLSRYASLMQMDYKGKTYWGGASPASTWNGLPSSVCLDQRSVDAIADAVVAGSAGIAAGTQSAASRAAAARRSTAGVVR